MARGFSGWSLLLGGLSGQRRWREQWRAATPKRGYDAVIVGGGGHGLACAYYLAKQHGMRDIAVVEKGWIGGGNTGRNTTIIRSNYLYSESSGLYDHAVKLWETLSQELNYNVMYSPRGVLMLAHSVHDEQVARRHIHANYANGVDNEWLTPAGAKAFCPPLNISNELRYPVLGGALQRRGGTARHDAVAWGYARAANALGVDIIENCEVTGMRRDSNGAICALETNRGIIESRRVGVSAAGHSSVVMRSAGVRLPLESFPLQALVSEPVKPVMPCVVMSNTIHAYISQSDKGELVIGASTDAYTSYTQTRRPARQPAHARGGLRDCSHRSGACACCATGAASSMSRPTARRSWRRRRCPGCTSTAAGARAASRPPPAPGTCSPGPGRPRCARMRSTHRSRSSASATGTLIDEAAAAAVSH